MATVWKPRAKLGIILCIVIGTLRLGLLWTELTILSDGLPVVFGVVWGVGVESAVVVAQTWSYICASYFSNLIITCIIKFTC